MKNWLFLTILKEWIKYGKFKKEIKYNANSSFYIGDISKFNGHVKGGFAEEIISLEIIN